MLEHDPSCGQGIEERREAPLAAVAPEPVRAQRVDQDDDEVRWPAEEMRARPTRAGDEQKDHHELPEAEGAGTATGSDHGLHVYTRTLRHGRQPVNRESPPPRSGYTAARAASPETPRSSLPPGITAWA